MSRRGRAVFTFAVLALCSVLALMVNDHQPPAAAPDPSSPMVTPATASPPVRFEP